MSFWTARVKYALATETAGPRADPASQPVSEIVSFGPATTRAGVIFNPSGG